MHMKKRDSGWKPHRLVFWDSEYEKEAAGGFPCCLIGFGGFAGAGGVEWWWAVVGVVAG